MSPFRGKTLPLQSFPIAVISKIVQRLGLTKMRSLFCAVSLIVVSTAATVSLAQDTATPDPQANAWSVLNQGLTSTNMDLRVKAVRVLGELPGDAKAENAALTALKDDKPEVRTAAAQALGEMGAKNADPQLREMLQDTEPSVIIAAAYALVQLGDDKGYDVYYAVLTGEQKTGTSLSEQQKKMLKDPKKMASLGLQAGIGFVPFGGLAVTGYKMLTRDDTSPVLAAAAIMLAKDPDPKSGEALANAAANHDKWLVRQAAFNAIAKRGDPNLLADSVTGLQDEKPEVQYSAAGAVLRLTDIQAQQTTHPEAPKRKPAPRKKPAA
jgi:HEAT repeat protein